RREHYRSAAMLRGRGCSVSRQKATGYVARHCCYQCADYELPYPFCLDVEYAQERARHRDEDRGRQDGRCGNERRQQELAPTCACVDAAAEHACQHKEVGELEALCPMSHGVDRGGHVTPSHL